MPAILQIPGTATLATPFDFTAAAAYPLGTRMVSQDGRAWRYTEAGSPALVAGSVYQSEVPNAADDDLVVAAAAVGARSITITANAEAIVADEFNGGYMVVQDDAGEGRAYLVEDTPAASASVDFSLLLAHGVEVALTASSTVLLLKHPLKDVIIHPSPPTAPVVGVAAAAVTANQFGWLQTEGMASVLAEGTVVISQQVRASETTDGAVAALDYDESGRDEAILGVVAEVSISGEHSAVNLSIS
ncbi:MAG TPA: hypothetical protein VGA20_04405 [Gemmatimonadales bacterium]